jgi:hypothetical protein
MIIICYFHDSNGAWISPIFYHFGAGDWFGGNHLTLGRILPATGKDSVTLRTPTRLRVESEKMEEGWEPIEELLCQFEKGGPHSDHSPHSVTVRSLFYLYIMISVYFTVYIRAFMHELYSYLEISLNYPHNSQLIPSLMETYSNATSRNHPVKKESKKRSQNYQLHWDVFPTVSSDPRGSTGPAESSTATLGLFEALLLFNPFN